jgi:hypothetical protein
LQSALFLRRAGARAGLEIKQRELTSQVTGGARAGVRPAWPKPRPLLGVRATNPNPVTFTCPSRHSLPLAVPYTLQPAALPVKPKPAALLGHLTGS